MGIPAYFSYIIKNYPKILKRYNNVNSNIKNLFLDSNSIIYDSMRNIEIKNDNDLFEKELINAVCKKIETYIQQISPSHFVFIAFDGVAPVAKLNQQKNRRYKSWFINDYDKKTNNWDSTAITPGTEFMNKLNLQTKYYFRKPNHFKVKNIIISGSDIPGEGEHKIFEYIRNNYNKDKLFDDETKTVIYGLDADLIMLTINHLNYCKNMYLFRETPDYIKNIDKALDPNYLYVVDIPQFKNNIINYFHDSLQLEDKNKNTNSNDLVSDYIFLCFILGNDFLPHFPAINIRTRGIDILMETYKNILGNANKTIIKDGQIIWKHLRILLQDLALNEEMYIQNEYKTRDKQEKKPIIVEKDASEFERKMLHAPIKNREVEKYINPFDEYWEIRYYDMLFDIDINDDWRKKISINYLEGLEWTWKYYTYGCVDWKWCYKYHYPPLLKDLLKYTPYFNINMIEHKIPSPVSYLVQLSYVLPRNSLYLLPKKIKQHLIDHYHDYYRNDYEFQWAFCKYFWECHVEFSEIKIEELEEIITKYS